MTAAASWTANKKERRRCSVVFSNGAPIDEQLLAHLDRVENKNFELKRLAYLGLQFERFEAIMQAGSGTMAATVPFGMPAGPTSIAMTSSAPHSSSNRPSSIRKNGSEHTKQKTAKYRNRPEPEKQQEAESASSVLPGSPVQQPEEDSCPAGQIQQGVTQGAATGSAEPVGVQEFVMPTRGEVSEEHERLADMMFGPSG